MAASRHFEFDPTGNIAVAFPGDWKLTNKQPS